MRDQVKALTEKGIRACFLGSAQPDAHVELAALEGRFELIYVCPETLIRLLPGLRRLRLSVCAIDEAHCIAAWGHDFRPDYAKLRTLKQEFPGTPMMALTATASQHLRVVCECTTENARVWAVKALHDTAMGCKAERLRNLCTNVERRGFGVPFIRPVPTFRLSASCMRRHARR